MKKKKPKTLREIKWRDELASQRRAWSRQHTHDLLAQTTLEQRRIFIETIRHNGVSAWDVAMKEAGIASQLVAYAVYKKNSRPSKIRILAEPENVR